MTTTCATNEKKIVDISTFSFLCMNGFSYGNAWADISTASDHRTETRVFMTTLDIIQDGTMDLVSVSDPSDASIT